MTRLAICLLLFPAITSLAGESRPNILVITVDDMNCDSVGAFGCKLQGTTPHIDGLAQQGIKFEYAHVQVGNCMPSRNVMWSGLYPHNNQVEGFYQVKDPGYPMVVDLMKTGGYFTAIRGKVSHSTPFQPYEWDLVLDKAHEGVHPKNIKSYYDSTKVGIEASQKAKKPFCLIVNISDPHKPFYRTGDANVPTRTYSPKEVPIPGFLYDSPAVRTELADYYSSVRRADDCVGAVLRALDESGLNDSTMVMFLSDHGMPLPFAKTCLYHHSTRTPWIVRWPGRTKAGSIDNEHMISAVDMLPTLLEVAGIAGPKKLDGRSFAPLLEGKKQTGREMIFKVYNENSGAGRHPMRGVQTKRFGYLFNPWSDGKRKFRTATMGTQTYRQMVARAQRDPKFAARLKLFDYRQQEEFYDYANDPDGLNNLIDHPEFQDEIARLRRELTNWMRSTNDHALEAMLHRKDATKVAAYMERVESEAQARRKTRRPKNAKRRRKLIAFSLPKTVKAGASVKIQINHKLPKRLAEQLLHVTLKDADAKRIERKVVRIKGNGMAIVEFKIPATSKDMVRFAAFVGKDYRSNLQHITQAATLSK